MFPSKIPENRPKSQKTLNYSPGKFFWAMSWISFKTHLPYLKFDGDHESVSYFDLSSIVEELSVYFRCISGVLPAKIEFSNCLKVKSELCSPNSFYQFKHSLSKEKVGFFNLLVFKEPLDWESSLWDECLRSHTRCLLLLSWKNVRLSCVMLVYLFSSFIWFILE